MPIAVNPEIQLAVDQYLNLYRQFKAIKDELDGLRKVIEPYMRENELDVILASDGRGQVERTVQERPVMNARYTTYDLAELSSLLPANVRKKCVVEVIDKERLEALHRLGEVSDAILQCKVTKPSHQFSARLRG
jgi:hypothetical protein